MPVIQIDKDLTTPIQGFILHQSNCFGMGAGIAKQLINKYPKVHAEHQKLVKKHVYEEWKLLGEAQAVKVTDVLYVVNLFGQYDTGTDYRRTEYGSLHAALNIFAAEHLNNFEYPNVYLPYKMGCNLGGGAWDIVLSIIKDVFKDYPGNVYICKHQPKA
jgi:hypothetical protein